MEAATTPDRPERTPGGQGPDRLGRAAAVLWDIDGTLLTSSGVAARMFLDAVQQVTGKAPDPAGLDFGGRIDPEIATLLLATVGHDDTQVPAVLERLAALAQANLGVLQARTRVLPGVRALVGRLAAAGIRQSVVTGNIRSVADAKLGALGLIPPILPDLGGYGDSGTDRVEVARSALVALFGDGWAEHARSCWIIGDTRRDLACAQALGLRCALVASGRTGIGQLTGQGADVTLTSLHAPAELRRLWGPGPDPV